MLIPLILLLVWRVEAGYRCTNSSDEALTFTKSKDGVDGRYTAEYCTWRDPNVTEWQVDLGLYKPAYCSSNATLQSKPEKGHSTSYLDVTEQLDCDHVCYSMDFDLIFGTSKYCYGLKSILIANKTAKKPFNSYHMITNNMTEKYYLENKPHITFINHDKEVSLLWRLGIPVNDYKVEIQNISNFTDEGLPVSCSRGALPDEVRCRAALAPGRYSATLLQLAPWAGGMFASQQRVSYDFNHTTVRPPELEGPETKQPALRWACGALLAAAGAGGALLLARGALLRRSRYKQLLADLWRQRLESEPASLSPEVQVLGGPILFLYAREGEAGASAAAALRALLEQATHAQVLDMFSPEVLALAGPAPQEWVRTLLQREDARVVLLQSPAMALHARLEQADDTTLCPPLLGARAQYRRPQFGDSLLQFALRLAAGLPDDHHAYRKYYLAQYGGLPTELFPHIVPYRRYSLPLHLPTLLHDLAPNTQQQEQQQLAESFASAAQAFVQLATEDPNYLMDELVAT